MSRHDNFHSSAVAWLKVLLPLLALGVLSTLFLVSRTFTTEDSIPLSRANIEERIRQPQLTAPIWAGVTDDGGTLTVTADVARPNREGAAGPDADAVIAKLVTPDGLVTDMTGDHGSLDGNGQLLTMTGNVVIITSTGFQLDSEALTTALDSSLVVSEGPVTGTGPFGRIDAGSMRLARKDPVDPGVGEAGPNDYLLVFKNGVTLLLRPQG